MLEATVEAAFMRGLKRRGLMALKLNLQGNRGLPDRLVVLPRGRVVFVELKRPGGKPRPLQEYVHAQLRQQGHHVIVADDAQHALDAVDARRH